MRHLWRTEDLLMDSLLVYQIELSKLDLKSSIQYSTSVHVTHTQETH